MDKKHLFFLSLIIASFLSYAVMPGQTFADGCKLLYGGGITKQQFCPTPQPEKEHTAPLGKTTTKPNAMGQTKGGLLIYPTTKKTTTPDTGPEAGWILLLLPLAASGLFLRKTKVKT